jgi:hypothetical protein
MTPVISEIAIIPPASRLSSLRLSSGIAVSRIPRSRNGDTMPRHAERKISPQTTKSLSL